MKTQKSSTAKLFAIAALFFILGSLGYAAQSAADQTTAKEVEEKTAQALQAIANYTADQRDEAIKRAKEILNDLDTRINRLESELNRNWDRMDQAARTKAQQTLAALRKHRTEVAEWYGGLKHSSSKAWEDVKAGFLKSYHELRDAFEKAVKEF